MVLRVIKSLVIKQILRLFLQIILFFCLTINTTIAQTLTKPNILFIAVDDLKPTIGCFGDTIAKTPNIDAIANSGVVFTRNYCQQAICAPSRASLLTGRYPDQLQVWDLQTLIREKNPGILTLPQYFKDNGYTTAATGKIFDPRSLEGSWGGPHDAPSWSLAYTQPNDFYASTGKPEYFYASQEARDTINILKEKAIEHGYVGSEIRDYVKQYYFPATESADVPYDAYIDGALANHGIYLMEQLANGEKPFFLAVGFQRPHLPFAAPQKYWDMYDRDSVPLALFQNKALDSPDIAYHNSNELRGGYTGVPENDILPIQYQQELVHGYYSAVSYIDDMIGKLIQKLKSLGIADNTIIILWGDHGWHLGDHGLWCKHSNFEQATRSPLLISYPNQPNSDTICESPVEFTDIAPTLCDIAGLEIPVCFEGKSLVPLINLTSNSIREASLSQYPRNNNMGYTLRTERYRYTKWVNKTDKTEYATELYDYENDYLETINLIGNPEYIEIEKRLDSLIDIRIAEPSTQDKLVFKVFGIDSKNDTALVENASIEFEGYKQKTNNNGEVIFTHHQGDFQFYVNAQGYGDFSDYIQVQKDTMVSLFLIKKKIDATLKIIGSWNGLPMQNATVFFNNQIYQSDTFGIVDLGNVEYNTYNIDVVLEGNWSQAFSNIEIHDSNSILLSIDKPSYVVDFQLTNFYNGDGIASVNVNFNSVEKSTGRNGIVEYNEIEGTYILSLIHEYYPEIIDTIHIDSDTSFFYNLKPSAADIKFWLQNNNTPVNQASINIIGSLIKTDPLGIAKFLKMPTKNNYSYSVEKSGYQSIYGELFLVQDTTIYLQMGKSVSTNSIDNSDNFEVRPNPTYSNVYVCIPNEYKSYNLLLFNILGFLVLKKII